MAEDLEKQVKQMFKSIYDAADIKYLRPIKRNMFRCGIDCLDDNKTVSQAEECIDNCGRTMHKAMSIVQTEVNAFQGRIDRCLMDCQDGVRNERDETKARRLFDECADKCVKKFVPVVPDVSKAICQQLEELKKRENIN